MAKPILRIEGTNLIFRNLSGKTSEYNKNGERITGVIIPPEMVEQLVDEGWNVKHTKPKDPQAEPTYYMNVKCRFDNIPPKVYLCTERKKTKLEEEDVAQIDYSEISSIDIEISPYDYQTAMGSGRSAYIKTMYVNVVEDYFAEKYTYGDVED